MKILFSLFLSGCMTPSSKTYHNLTIQCRNVTFNGTPKSFSENHYCRHIAETASQYGFICVSDGIFSDEIWADKKDCRVEVRKDL